VTIKNIVAQHQSRRRIAKEGFTNQKSLRETIRALGGQLEVESTPGSGTRFRISLPLHNNDVAGGDAA